MHRIDSSGATADNLFTNGDPTSGVQPTMVDADWLNAVQENICQAIEAAGLVLAKGDGTQLADAILAFIASHVPAPELATEEAAGISRRSTMDEALAGVATTPHITPVQLAAALAAALGGANTEEGFIGGGAMWPSVTNGASPAVIADVTNNLTRAVMLFKGAANDTSAEMDFRLPSNWDRGTMRAKVLWTASAGASAADNVRFSLAGVAVGDGDALDVAPGEAVTIDDTVTAVGVMQTSPASAALTVAGDPQVGDLLRFKLTRNYAYGASPMVEEAQVLGIVLQYGKSGSIAAW